ncbi:MAG: DUF4143 domain-containing protein [Propionibacteriaceae bacterium]|jgi:predicted AAA+ superfamily ATPase|nr:DUF4143 domain-containing protein [Propionibacteriaceae bacterium]
MSYLPRVADAELASRLRRSGAVLIEGPRACGKTELALRAAASVIRVETDPNVTAYMEVDPGRILEGATPRLLDEWQWEPRLWDHVRRAVDDRRTQGQFILTGSATPRDDARRHSGAGRVSPMRLRTMSLWERGKSSGEISWETVRRGEAFRAEAIPLRLDDLAELVVRGGWPATLDWEVGDASAYVRDYLTLLADVDINRLSGTRRDPARVRRLLASLGRNVATESSISTIATDVSDADATLHRQTASEYLAALERLMITEVQPAWSTALKDSATLRRSPRWHFADPSLAAAAMGATVEKLVREPKTLGNLVESLAVHDLRVYAAGSDGQVFHYRDSIGREIDAVIQYPDGWVACEIKLGPGAVDAAAHSLTRAVASVDTQSVGEPDALVIITGTGPGYRRPDGIAVIPLGALRP